MWADFMIPWIFTDPALLDKTAGFFLQHEQYDKAVDLYVASVQAIKALELCLQYNINISEEMAEKLSTGDKFEANPPDEKVQVRILLLFAAFF